MKEVLVIYYSQTGQLRTILDNVAKHIHGDDVNISYFEIIPKPKFEFPWQPEKFYDAFPESFLQVPRDFQAPSKEILDRSYDLVILGYQVWYLTPSIPINSFLKSEYAEQLLKNTPVVTILACRNMWIQAQEKMKKLLHVIGANLVGHIALVDRHINHVSVITISHWMFSGRKDRYLGIFPKPGVSDLDISQAERFGPPIKKAIKSNNFRTLQKEIIALNGVKIIPFLVMTDKRGNVLFSKWANLIIKKGEPGNPKRSKWIGFFKFYLLFAIWVIAPIVFVVFLITYLPSFKQRKIDKAYYSSVALKEN
ncbi:flavodoxin family protein [Maribacter sp. CXY002]|uniref:flavodoxin family protein n=1 Tax=Maribacter luteocoastalis TaxID=3407671 RepID=UPI003B68585B